MSDNSEINDIYKIFKSFDKYPISKQIESLHEESETSITFDKQHKIKSLKKEIEGLKDTEKFIESWITENKNINNCDYLGRTIFYAAIDENKINCFRYLVEEYQCDVNTIDRYGWNLLHRASHKGHLDIVKYLVEKFHCDVNSKDNEERTPLHEASCWGHLNIVKYLIEECNCDPNVKDKYEKPLFIWLLGMVI